MNDFDKGRLFFGKGTINPLEPTVFMNDFRKQIQQTEFKMSAPTFRLCPPDVGREVAFAGRSNAGKSSAINALTNQRQLARSSKTPGRTQMINFFTIVAKTEWDGEIDTNINKGKKKLAAINHQRATNKDIESKNNDIKDDSIHSDNNETESNDVINIDLENNSVESHDVENSGVENSGVENNDIENIINTDLDVEHEIESDIQDEKRLIDLPGYGYASVPEAMKIKWQVELEEYLVSRKSLVGLVLLTDIRHPLKHYDEQMLRWAKDAELPVHILLTKADKLKFGAQKNTLLKLRRDLKKLELPCTVQLFSALKKEGLDDLANMMGDWLEMDTLETDE